MKTLIIILIIYIFNSLGISGSNKGIPEKRVDVEVKQEVALLQPTPTASVLSQREDSIISVVNRYRIEKGLSPLIHYGRLSNGAQKRAKYLVDHNQWSHVMFKEHFKEAGFKYGAENLAIDFTSDEDVVKAWTLSEAHAQLIFSNSYKYVGIGRYGTIIVMWMK